VQSKKHPAAPHKPSFSKKQIKPARINKKKFSQPAHHSPTQPQPSITKAAHNPIIAPEERNDWESWQTFNPAAVLVNDAVHFLYRAIGCDGISRFGYANSKDGFLLDERHPVPVYQESDTHQESYVSYSLASGGSWGGCEDPRLVHIAEDDKIYMTYTSCREGLRIGLSSIRVNDLLNKRWRWSQPRYISPPGEVHKNWIIFPEKINGQYAILHSISPRILVAYRDSLEFKAGEYIYSYYHPSGSSKRWDSYLRGPGPTPIKTKHGWLIFYHAMSHNSMSKYKIGAMLLDLEDPTKILHRSAHPILEPSEYYEMDGFKPGVVYVLGAAIKGDDLILYYGGADSYVCVAYVNLADFLGELVQERKKPLQKKLLKTKK